MAKKEAKKKSTKKTEGGVPGIRAISRPVGKVEDFKPVRAGTDRAKILKEASTGGKKTVTEVAKAVGTDRGTVMQHLFFLNRDCAIGYEVTKEDELTVSFPGSRTVKDAIKEKEAAAD